MGQGPITSLPQMLAEDLDVSIDDISMVMGDTDLCPFDQGTWGSQTTQVFGTVWRTAAAEARGALLEQAAENAAGARRPACGQPGRGHRRQGPVAKDHLRPADQGQEDRAPGHGEAEPQDAGPVPDHRQAASAQGLARQGDGKGGLRGRRPPARDALRPRAARPGARGHPEAGRHLGAQGDRGRRRRPAARPRGRPARAARRRGGRLGQGPRRIRALAVQAGRQDDLRPPGAGEARGPGSWPRAATSRWAAVSRCGASARRTWAPTSPTRRWRPTRRSPTWRGTARRYGPPPRTPSEHARRSPWRSASRSRASGSSPPLSAAALAASPSTFRRSRPRVCPRRRAGPSR